MAKKKAKKKAVVKVVKKDPPSTSGIIDVEVRLPNGDNINVGFTIPYVHDNVPPAKLTKKRFGNAILKGLQSELGMGVTLK